MNVDPKETGLPLCASQVRALLDGRKATHRVAAKFKAIEKGYHLTDRSLQVGHWHPGIPNSGTLLGTSIAGVWKDRTHPLDCPYGLPGDHLWLQEEWCKHGGLVTYREDGDWIEEYAQAKPEEFAALKKLGIEPKWQPAETLPQDLARAHMEITAFRVERLKAITADQAIAEGLITLPASGRYVISLGDQHAGMASEDPREVYFWLWALNGGNWKSNPWVWVIDFKKVEDAT